jgi:inner membrane transporter RhtA
MVLAAVVSVQLGSAAATTLFDRVGPAGAVLYRILFAAILLLALWRPRPLEADRSGLTLAVAFGVTLAAMNFCFYEALDRIPLGIAVTLEFVGPLTVALVGSRRALDLVWVAAAAVGVVLLAGHRDRRRQPAWASPSSPERSGRPTSSSAPASAGPSRAAAAWRWRWDSPRR